MGRLMPRTYIPVAKQSPAQLERRRQAVRKSVAAWRARLVATQGHEALLAINRINERAYRARLRAAKAEG